MRAPPAYHVFVYDGAKDKAPKGGLHDLVSVEDSLEKARRAVDQCAASGRGYHIAVVDPEDNQLTVVERGSFVSNPRRKPTEVFPDPWARAQAEG